MAAAVGIGLAALPARADDAGPANPPVDPNLVRMGQGLLDNGALKQMGNNLLETQGQQPHARRGPRDAGGTNAQGRTLLLGPDGRPVLGPDGGPLAVEGRSPLVGTDGRPILGPDGGPLFAEARRVLVGPDGQPVVGPDGGLVYEEERRVVIGPNGLPLLAPDGGYVFEDVAEDAGPDAPSDAAPDDDAGGPSPSESAKAGRDAGVAAKPAATPGPGGGGRAPPRREPPMAGPSESPLASVLPVAAVPPAATAITVGAMAVWPAILKTLTGLVKSNLTSRIKNRAKKGQKIDTNLHAVNVLGISVRPAELRAIAVAALVYGLAVCYTVQGFKMKRGFFLSQEGLVLLFYYARSVIRFAYERAHKLSTQYRFWIMGGFLCLGSAYLGNTLGTVGYELEGSSKPEDAHRAVAMKAWLVLLAFAMALVFYALNREHPVKIYQSARLMMSGAALAEILPIAPMPGQKIMRWNKRVWAPLFLTIVPGFFLINYVL